MNQNDEFVRLSELAVEKGLVGGPFGSSLGNKDYVSSGVPVIRGKNLGGPGRFNPSDFVYVTQDKVDRELARNTAKPGDVVFTQRGTLGQVGLVPETPYDTYVISQSQMRLRVDPRRADARYIYYCFRDPKMLQRIKSRAIVTGVPHINLGILGDIPISNRPIRDQQVVADALSALDDKLDADRTSIRLADELLATVFQKLAAPALANLSEDDPLPSGWRRDRLESVLGILETGQRPRGGVAMYKTGIPSLGAESIVGLAQYDYSKIKFVPTEFFEGMKRGIIEDRDVLLYKDGGRPGEFEPHVSLLGDGFPFPKFCINEHVYRLRACEPMSQEFLYYWLSSEPILDEMRRRGTGVAIPGLNSTAVKDLPIDIPPKAILDEFTALAQPIVSFALATARESRLLALLRDTLLPELLSGELRIHELELAAEEAV
jgi:type I restriction enzyme S subunit